MRTVQRAPVTGWSCSSRCSPPSRRRSAWARSAGSSASAPGRQRPSCWRSRSTAPGPPGSGRPTSSRWSAPRSVRRSLRWWRRPPSGPTTAPSWSDSQRWRWPSTPSTARSLAGRVRTRARGAVRHGGRRLPHPRAQRRGRPGRRLVGPGHRVRPVRVAARRAGVALAAGRRSRRATGARWSPRSRASRSRSSSPGCCRPRWRWSSFLALLLLAESFGRDLVWLTRRNRSRRPRAGLAVRGPADPTRSWLTPTRWLVRPARRPRAAAGRRRRRRVLGVVATVLAVALLWAALDLPNRPEQLRRGGPRPPPARAGRPRRPRPRPARPGRGP